MTFLRVIHVKGRYYLYEKESYWDKELKKPRQRVVRYLGPCDAEGDVLSPPKARVDSVHSAFPAGSLSVFYSMAEKLNVKKRIEEALSVDAPAASLVLSISLNQIVSRLSLSRLPQWLLASPLAEWEGIEHVERSELDEALSALCHYTPFGTLEDRGLVLQQLLTKEWRGKSHEPASYHYDITKQEYFGDMCPYAAMGHASDRSIKNVVGFGLVTSKVHHHPVLCRAVNGSRNDTVTVKDTISTLKAFGFEHLTLIMDRGMVSRENMETIVQSGYDQIGIVKESNTETWEYLSKWPSTLQQPQFVVAHPSGETAYARAWTGQLMGKRMRLAIVEHPELRAHEKGARDLTLNELDGHPTDDRLKELKDELKDVITPARGRRGFTVNSEAVEEEAKRDGRFLMFSTDMSVDASEMFTIYFQRDSIEKAFRTTKGELSLAPLRYRRKDRIDAYTTVLYMAYLLWSWAEHTLRDKFPAMTLQQALNSLSDVSIVTFQSDKFMHRWTTRLTDEQDKLLSLFGATKYLHVS